MTHTSVEDYSATSAKSPAEIERRRENRTRFPEFVRLFDELVGDPDDEVDVREPPVVDNDTGAEEFAELDGRGRVSTGCKLVN